MVHRHWISSGKGWKIVLKITIAIWVFMKIKQQNNNIFLEIYKKICQLEKIAEIENLQKVNILCVVERV